MSRRLPTHEAPRPTPPEAADAPEPPPALDDGPDPETEAALLRAAKARHARQNPELARVLERLARRVGDSDG